jgi:hypothetical protein
METLRIARLRINGFSVDWNRADLPDEQALASKGGISSRRIFPPFFLTLACGIGTVT